ncbi:SDR family NAD(P)-dependent oxidoreductase [Croceicoccus sp. F390]|uniref:SDR family NAD(P)-dependent oxidoreductase n=1 Tax=Croceicoccus esteveae TaxID=3075597 RepID=A0ABU2ZEA1_9SPHN|nr:SDR family NAD(P)-dependent oxidoreductase [Croceicoccus sp. F390]MDT0574933.1 SDR family NAD(P)-dependent oxidoreductase [Croceicoccus sp. F390]
MTKAFAGKKVLITGGGVGIGRATAEAFRDEGAQVAIIEKDADRLAEARTALGDAALCISGDVTKQADVAAAMQQISDSWGAVDVLVNNVGDSLGVWKPHEAMSDEDIDKVLTVNLTQVLSVTRSAIPLLRKAGPGGAIVTVSSIEGFRGIPNLAVYAAGKAGLTGFTQSLALELGPEGIRVNQIAPETTETPQVPVSVAIGKEHQHHIPRWIPLGRFGQPGDCADAILFLASDKAQWITGSTIHVDGGALAAAGWYRDQNNTWTNVPVITGNGLNL